jgi:uncharacterized membrane protein
MLGATDTKFYVIRYIKFFGKKLCKLEIIDWIMIMTIIIYSVVFSYYTILRHYSFRSNAWDLGIIVQSIASTVKGRLFTNNAELYYSPTGSYFGIHFAPILFLTVPFFYIAQTVETILVLQSIVLALGAIPVYFIALYTFKDKLSALLLSASYLLNPLLQGINWYDFHTQAFFPLFILSATYFLKRRKTIAYIFFIILTLSTLEQATYFVISYIPYCLYIKMREMEDSQKSRLYHRRFFAKILFPLTTLIIVIMWYMLSSKIKHIINPNPPQEIKATRGFKYLDISDPVEIPSKVISNPELALKAFQYEIFKKIFYIVITFAPTCFLALVSPISLLPAFLWIFLACLSNWGPYYSLGFQYTAFTLPFTYIATIDAIRIIYLKEINEIYNMKIIRRLSMIILLVGVILSIFLSPLSPIHTVGSHEYFRDYGISMPSIMNEQIISIISRIPNESSILTTPTIFPHLSTNLNAYTIPPINHPSPRLFRSHIEYLKNNIKFDYILITSFWDKLESELIYTEFIKSSNDYGLFIKGPGLQLYRRRYEGLPEKISIKLTYRELYLADSIIIDDPTSEIGKIIMLKASSTSGRTAWYGPYITLLPGNYTAKFKIKVDAMKEGKIIKLDVWSNQLGQIASYNVYGKDIIKPFTWHIFSISFTIGERIGDVEFRGLEAGSDVTICLDYIEVIPVS